MPEIPTLPGQTGINREISPEAPSGDLARTLMPRVYGAGGGNVENMLPEFATVGSQPTFAKAIRVAAKQSVEIEIPVGAAANFGMTFMADALVSATLVNNMGIVVGKNLAGSPESRGMFRSVYFDKATTAGTWKLKLENTGDYEYEAIVTTWDIP